MMIWSAGLQSECLHPALGLQKAYIGTFDSKPDTAWSPTAIAKELVNAAAMLLDGLLAFRCGAKSVTS